MSLSALERRELLAIANTFEAFRHSPEMIARYADSLRVWTIGKERRSESTPEHQEQLGFDSEPVESNPSVHSAYSFEAPSRSADETSRSSPVESDSSSSPINEVNRRQQRGPFTLCLDSPFTADFARVFAQVAAARSTVTLPRGEYVWGKFCEWCVAKEKAYVRYWNQVRAFRQFAEKERPLVESVPPASGHQVKSKVAASSPPAAPPKPRPAHTTDAALFAVLATTTGTLQKAGAIRAPPEPKSASA